MGKIFVIGDLHGNSCGEVHFLNSRYFKEKKDLTKEDVLIQLGDFGFYWYYPNTYKYQEDLHWRNWIGNQPYTLLIVPGNHENYDLINALPEVEKWGGKVFVDKTKYGEIYLAKRGEIYTINDKKILTIGGAQSGDISNRKTFKDFEDKKCKVYQVSYWEQETLNDLEKKYIVDNLDKNNNEVDYVFSHTAPSSILAFDFTINAQKIKDPTAIFLDFILDITTAEQWHFGHVHSNRIKYVDQCKFQSHYQTTPFEIKG